VNRLQELLSGSHPDIRVIGEYLDGLDHPRRQREALSLSRGQQRRLFDAAEGFRAITLETIVPPEKDAMEEVPHQGLNTLPTLRRFAKVFVRPDDEGEGELWGYNRNSALLETAVGPGYYVAHDHHVEGEVLVNYLRVPPRRPAGWPEILPNSARLSRFVYHGTQDVLRGVTEHVSIGRAMKAGRWLPAWFVLCRA